MYCSTVRQVLGFLTIVSLSGVFGFGIMPLPGFGLMMGSFGDLDCMILGNLLALLSYVGVAGAQLVEPRILGLFSAGVRWYATIAVGVGLMIAGAAA